MLIEDSHANLAGSSSHEQDVWKVLWRCGVPHWIKLFGWWWG